MALKASWVIFLVALVVRLIGLAVYGVDQRGDAVEYDRLAFNLSQGHGYSLSLSAPFTRTTQREPTYPLVVALIYRLVGHQPFLVILFQCLLGSLVCLVMYVLARLLYDDRRVAVLAGLLNAVYVPIAIFNLRLLSETVATGLLAVIAYQLVRLLATERNWPQYLFLGLATGLLILTKLIFLFLPVFMVPALMGSASGARRVGKPLVCLALIGLMVLPWCVFTRTVHGSTAMGNSVRMGANLYIRVMNDGMKGPLGMRVELYEHLRELEEQGIPVSTLNADAVRNALEIIRAHPIRYLAGVALEIRDLWRFGLDASEIDVTAPMTLQGPKGTLFRSVKAAFQVLNVAVLVTGVLGFLVKVTTRSSLVMLLILYATLMFALVSCALPRHNVPILPLMLVFSSQWIVWCRDRRQGVDVRPATTRRVLMSTGA